MELSFNQQLFDNVTHLIFCYYYIVDGKRQLCRIKTTVKSTSEIERYIKKYKYAQQSGKTKAVRSQLLFDAVEALGTDLLDHIISFTGLEDVVPLYDY